MEYDCDSEPDAQTAKEEPDSEGGFPPVDKRVSTPFVKIGMIPSCPFV